MNTSENLTNKCYASTSLAQIIIDLQTILEKINELNYDDYDENDTSSFDISIDKHTKITPTVSST